VSTQPIQLGRKPQKPAERERLVRRDVWEVTSGFPALSAHVLVEEDEDCHAERRELEKLLEERFHLHHATLQVDHATPEVIELSRKEDQDEGLEHSHRGEPF
jgi:cobalt-zinc-cadmium efflux system protein